MRNTVCFRIAVLGPRFTAVLGCILAVFLSAGCTKVTNFIESSNPYHTDDYKITFDKWSRETRIHRGLEVDLIASATYKSHEFSQAYLDEYAKAYRLREGEKKQFAQAQLVASGEAHEFMMAVYVPEKKWDEFDKVESMWKLYLVNDNNERVAPREIRRLKSKDAVATHFFPYITPWKTVYTVTFPASVEETKTPIIHDGTSTIKLVIASILGTAEMVWALDRN